MSSYIHSWFEDFASIIGSHVIEVKIPVPTCHVSGITGNGYARDQMFEMQIHDIKT